MRSYDYKIAKSRCERVDGVSVFLLYVHIVTPDPSSVHLTHTMLVLSNAKIQWCELKGQDLVSHCNILIR